MRSRRDLPPEPASVPTIKISARSILAQCLSKPCRELSQPSPTVSEMAGAAAWRRNLPSRHSSMAIARKESFVGVGAAAMKSLDAYNLWLWAVAIRPCASRRRNDLHRGGASRPEGHDPPRRRQPGVASARRKSNAVDRRSFRSASACRANASPRGRPRTGTSLDIKTQNLEAQDRFLLTTEGVHAFLSANTLLDLLARRDAPQADADAIVDAAIEAGSDDNATAS